MRINRKVLLLLVSPLLLLVAAAYIQWGVAGLPSVPAPWHSAEPSGFPAWLRITHYVNFLFLILLIRSGLQILMDHPRLYWNVHCTPGTEWLRLTPVEVPKDRVWTAKDDSRYLSPWIGLPGYRHTIGMARHWHFLSVLFWVGNGAGLRGPAVRHRAVEAPGARPPGRSCPTPGPSSSTTPPSTCRRSRTASTTTTPSSNWRTSGSCSSWPRWRSLTGPSMSPALTNRFTWYPKLPGNRQIGRSLHFLVMCAFVVFLVGHVTMVALTGFVRNMNHIVVGTDDTEPDRPVPRPGRESAWSSRVNALANWMAWRHPRPSSTPPRRSSRPVMRFLLDRPAPRGRVPPRGHLARSSGPTARCRPATSGRRWPPTISRTTGCKVYGLVENPVELSLDDLRALGKKTQITLHHCIQGWSGIAEWGGLPLAELIKLVRPKPNAKAVVFYSFGEGVAFSTGVAGGQYYDSLSIENALNPQTLLAYEMNYQPLNHLHGAPLRLRVENQLGFKMVKWIQAIEFVEDVQSIDKGEGGYAEDHEYFGELANI